MPQGFCGVIIIAAMQIGKNSRHIKLIKQLKEKKYRDRHGLFIIEGPHLADEAIKSGSGFEFAVFSEKAPKEIISAIEEKDIPSFFIDARTMRTLSDTENDQGVLGVIPKFSYSRRDMKKDGGQTIVVCDGIQDPGNLGTIIRTAAAAGCGAVITSFDSADIYNPKTVRSTGGALFHIPVIAGENMGDILKYISSLGFRIFCAEPESGKGLFSVDLRKSFAIVIGSEGKGVRPEVRCLCDGAITIPVSSNIESLNAAAAAAVIMFEAVRQRALKS